jgi:hypothetical protein
LTDLRGRGEGESEAKAKAEEAGKNNLAVEEQRLVQFGINSSVV